MIFIVHCCRVGRHDMVKVEWFQHCMVNLFVYCNMNECKYLHVVYLCRCSV